MRIETLYLYAQSPDRVWHRARELFHDHAELACSSGSVVRVVGQQASAEMIRPGADGVQVCSCT